MRWIFTDRLRFAWPDENLYSGDAVGGAIQYGPGPGNSGAKRMAYNAGAYYTITAVSGNTITYQLSSEETFTTGRNAPYMGTRDWPTGTADPLTMSDNAEVVSATRQWGGFTTAIRVASGYAEMCAMQADLGSKYVVFEEPTFGDSADPRTYCGGEAYKVLHCERGAPSDTFVDANVTVANDSVTSTAHGLQRP